MTRIAYINGCYRPFHQATLSIEDRGLQFGDGIYIVVACVRGQPIDLKQHLLQLEKYLEQSQISFPGCRAALPFLVNEVIRRNRMSSGSLYLQVTRGLSPRRHAFPEEPAPPTLIILPYPHQINLDPEALDEVSVIFQDDIRWRHPFIKSTSLFPTVLLRQAAAEKGAFETWLIDEKGKISEGASSNAFIIMCDGVLRTRPDDGTLVPGVTRHRIIEIAKLLGIPVELKPFTRNDFYKAAEAFLTGATSMIKPVVRSEDWIIGSGKTGPLTKVLAGAYFEFCRQHELVDKENGGLNKERESF